MQWVAYSPPAGTGIDGRWPVVVVLHIGGYHGGNFYESLDSAPQDLAAAGFYVFVADYPLAPPNAIPNQADHSDSYSGRPPQQTRAVEAFLDAAKNDSHCYHGEVGILGGSAGAGHAAYVALDESYPDPSVWPFWSTANRPLFVACLSGQYDFTERDDDVTMRFVDDIENYTNTTSPYGQWAASPVAQIAPMPHFIPMFFVRSEEDSGCPPLQNYYMWNALHNASDTVFNRFWTIPGNSQHAFGYWQDAIHDVPPPLSVYTASYSVEDRVIGYFKQYLPIP